MTRNQEIEKAIAELAEHGRVAVVEFGREALELQYCDGIQYLGRVRIIRARLKDFLELEKRIFEWPDSPFHLSLERPSIARRNGRPHLLLEGNK